jgi:hypothetical protein
MRLVMLSAAVIAVAVIGAVLAKPPTTMPTTPMSKTPAIGDSCKLSPAELAARRQQLIPGLFERAEKVEDIPNGLRFHFQSKPALLTDLARIMEQEQDCCSFLRIQLTMEASEGPVTFDVTGPEGTADMLRKL